MFEQCGIAHLVQDLFVDAVRAQALDDFAFHQAAVHLFGEPADDGAGGEVAVKAPLDAPLFGIAEGELHFGVREEAVDRDTQVEPVENQLLTVGVDETDRREIGGGLAECVDRADDETGEQQCSENRGASPHDVPPSSLPAT